jgi:hypothetical protein
MTFMYTTKRKKIMLPYKLDLICIRTNFNKKIKPMSIKSEGLYRKEIHWEQVWSKLSHTYVLNKFKEFQ